MFQTLMVCVFSGDGYWEYLKGLITLVACDGSLSCVCCWLGSCATSVFGKESDPLERYTLTPNHDICTVIHIKLDKKGMEIKKKKENKKLEITFVPPI